MTTTSQSDSTFVKPAPQPVAVPPSSGNVDPRTLPFFGRDFAYIDTETTGVDAAVDKICEIAIVRFRDGVREVFHTLVDPLIPIPPTASAVHHITDRTIAEAKARGEAPTFPDIAHKVVEMLDGVPVYAHNRDFDEGFVDGELGVELDPKSWLCTVRLSRHLFPTAPAHGNQVLRYWLQTEPESANLGPHRAVDDVFTSLENTYHLWKAADMLGVKTHDGLLELCNRPIIVSTMHFGSHVGKDFKDIPSSYFEWALGRVPGKDGLADIDDDLRISMEMELDRPRRKEDDVRIKAEQDSKIVPATHMTFGNKHNGKAMDLVPMDYLEWIERDNPRCSPEVRAAVRLELTRRRETAGCGAQSPSRTEPQVAIVAAVYARLVGLVNKGSEEESLLRATEHAQDRVASIAAYLRDFYAAAPSEFVRVSSQLVGGAEGEWMMVAAGAKRASSAASTCVANPAASPDSCGESGRLTLFGKGSQGEPEAEDSAGPPPNFEMEGSSAPFESAAAFRRMRPR